MALTSIAIDAAIRVLQRREALASASLDGETQSFPGAEGNPAHCAVLVRRLGTIAGARAYFVLHGR